MRIAICDDDPVQIEYLSSLVKKWAEKKEYRILTDVYNTAVQFEFAWSEDKTYDILLLDIQMPGKSGMDLAKQIRISDQQIQIVFITGFTEYVEEGYDVDALHYLIKPIDEAKFTSVLDKAAARIFAAPVAGRMIRFHAEGSDFRVPEDQILYAEAFSHRLEIHTVSRIYTVKISMNEFSDKTGEGFFRCHRSYLVNLKFVRCITRKGMFLDDGTEIPLSRKLYDQANQEFIRYY